MNAKNLSRFAPCEFIIEKRAKNQLFYEKK